MVCYDTRRGAVLQHVAVGLQMLHIHCFLVNLHLQYVYGCCITVCSPCTHTHTMVCENAGVWSRLLHHCFTGRVQSLGVRPYCTRTKVVKRLQASLRSSSGPSSKEKTSCHRALNFSRLLNCEQNTNQKMKSNIREQICKLSHQQSTAQQRKGNYNKKSKQNVPQSVTAAKTNPIICVSCCKFVLMVEVRK